jgi:GMP synthase-like glutamine amidotransferase
MKVAILQTGAPPAELEARFGSYPEMLMTLLGHDGFDYEVFDVQAGPLPKRGDHHGVVIMGSPSGVYDGDAWIQDLKMWIIGAQGRCRMVGICFGHQIIGEANGCDVRKSERGWGIGVHSYQVEDRHGWMEPPLETVRLPVSHQDQVEYRGASTWVTLTSRFCPYAGLIHGRDTRPLHHGRHGAEDRFDIAAGLEAEGGAAVVEQVELDVAAAADQLLVAVGFGPGRCPSCGGRAGVAVQEGRGRRPG